MYTVFGPNKDIDITAFLQNRKIWGGRLTEVAKSEIMKAANGDVTSQPYSDDSKELRLASLLTVFVSGHWGIACGDSGAAQSGRLHSVPRSAERHRARRCSWR